MSKKLLLSLTIMAGVLFVGASPALATRLNCQDSLAKRAQYNTGVTIGRATVRQAWQSSSQDPNDFEEFSDFIRETLSNAISNLHNGPTEPSAAVRCRAKGLSQGFCDGLGIIQDQVSSVCLLDGDMWGALSGDIYCALATEFGGAGIFDLLPVAPTNLCGESFVDGCTGAFDAYAISLDTCVGFTNYDANPNDTIVPPHAGEYVSWQGGMCSYEIP
jgi:hypothetical protein